MTNQDAMLKSKHAEDNTTIANTLESPNEEDVDTKSPTIILQEEMSQALAESLKCSIRYWQLACLHQYGLLFKIDYHIKIKNGLTFQIIIRKVVDFEDINSSKWTTITSL